MTDTCLDSDSMNGKGYKVFYNFNSRYGRLALKKVNINNPEKSGLFFMLYE